MKVCVIGAGFAGLAAAEKLLDAGFDPLVLEARERVGGRVWSQQLHSGATIERGAEYSEPEHTVFRAAVTRLGLRFFPAGMSFTEREPRGGLSATRDELACTLHALKEQLAARPAEAAGLSAGAFLRSAPGSAGAREAIAARLQITRAHPVDDLPADTIAEMSFEGDEGLRVEGGNQGVALRLAARLGQRVRLGAVVDAVAWGQDGVRVRAGDQAIDADACVLAVPASVYGSIAFDPALPAWKAAALAHVTYGHAAKLFVPLRRVPPPSAVLSVTDHFWTWTAKGADGRVVPVVHAFAGSAPALRALEVSAGPGRWLERLRALRPELELDPAGAVLSTWDDDPYVGAAYSVRTLASSVPFTPAEPVSDTFSSEEPASGEPAPVARPVGAIYFAGEHTAGPWSGTMDGALRSGQRAADEVMARCGRRSH